MKEDEIRQRKVDCQERRACSLACAANLIVAGKLGRFGPLVIDDILYVAAQLDKWVETGKVAPRVQQEEEDGEYVAIRSLRSEG